MLLRCCCVAILTLATFFQIKCRVRFCVKMVSQHKCQFAATIIFGTNLFRIICIRGFLETVSGTNVKKNLSAGIKVDTHFQKKITSLIVFHLFLELKTQCTSLLIHACKSYTLNESVHCFSTCNKYFYIVLIIVWISFIL